MTLSVVLVTVLVLAIGSVEPHGALVDPRARNNLYLDPAFPNQPPNWNYQAVWCDDIPQDEAVSNCGFCGDPPNAPTPRENEHGGYYGNGYIAKNYTVGSAITIKTAYGAAHYGYFEVHLCSSAQESADCFERLIILSGSEEIRSDNRICVPYGNDQNREITATVLLPAGVRCNRCTLRWTYRTAYPGWSGWNECGLNPNNAQVFRNCADIAIL